MRIVFVCPGTLRRNTAGVEQSVYYLAQYLKKEGHEVEVYCVPHENPAGRVTYDGLSLTEFPGFSPNRAFYFSWELYRTLRESHHDIIHAYGYNSLPTMLAVLAKKNNEKLIITGASSISSSPWRKMLHPLLNVYYHALGAKIDKLICVSDYEYDLFTRKINIDPQKYTLIPNGIDVKRFSSAKKKRIPHMILTVARLVKQKGVHRLIAALPFVLKKYPDATLHIVGDGVERGALEKQAAELNIQSHVTFHGHIQFEKLDMIIGLYSNAHVFSLMADSESQGLVYGMAAATKCPIIATHSSAMKDLVKVGAAIGIENPDNAEEVAKGIMHSFEKPLPTFDLDQVIWSWDRIGKEVSRVYQEVLSPRKTGKTGSKGQ
ncbi:MAG: glycosyltransferase family 4 protein [Candidatus Diapherotrites archaeon]|uniref:Glycosyltransferase family 4 protein n=1 Tax=Candidatus Iainarchaeum sp. TaxID=3101447 RepID=A0A8T4C6R5_9ARCH|nr:glycosyltransferase family 4 protein [Candidatus Diapherotrites archaeon]